MQEKLNINLDSCQFRVDNKNACSVQIYMDMTAICLRSAAMLTCGIIGRAGAAHVEERINRSFLFLPDMYMYIVTVYEETNLETSNSINQ